jgi:MFS family permease
MSLIWGQFYGLFPIYAEKFVGISSSEMGVSYALEGAVLAIFSYFVSRWATKLNLVTVYQIGVLFFSLAALGVGAMPSLVGIIVFYSVIEAFAEMFCGPSSKAIMAKLAPPDQRGTYLGVLSLFQREFTSFAPLVGGILMDILIPKFMLFWAIFFSLGLLGVILCFPLKKMAKKSLE